MTATFKRPPLFLLLVFLSFAFSHLAHAQLSDECKLDIGVNLGGLADFGTELPFVDLMKNARTWYTRDVENPNAAFDSGFADSLIYREDGYPTHAPQAAPGADYNQSPVTIWAITDGWPVGTYTVLWEGSGELSFWGSHENLNQTSEHRMTFDFPNPVEGTLEMTILRSDINDPIHNIRVLMPGSEDTYQSQPFNPIFLDRMLSFKTVRFMDWGQTNNWGQKTYEWDDPTLFDWEDRSQMNHYTWAYEKGIPYEMMIQLMNDYDLDGWICVPYKANDNYMEQMANLFRDELEEDRHLTVEYSNENWNWIFGQAQWLNEYGCVQQGIDWPEGTVPYLQNCLDHFTTSFEGQMDRITRVVGAFTAWTDITERIAYNLTPNSFDAIAATFYFGFSEEDANALEALGTNATVDDIASFARASMADDLMYIQQTKAIADSLGVPLTFYEGGQHLTPVPFGSEPSYAQALIDIHRDTSMYNLYNEWFEQIRSIQSGEDPLQLMHFSFVSNRSARFGSWGMLETMDQDLSLTPAPKYTSILENMATEDCQMISNNTNLDATISNLKISPNPTTQRIQITPSINLDQAQLNIYNSAGALIYQTKGVNLYTNQPFNLAVDHLPDGIYYLHIQHLNTNIAGEKFIKISY